MTRWEARRRRKEEMRRRAMRIAVCILTFAWCALMIFALLMSLYGSVEILY